MPMLMQRTDLTQPQREALACELIDRIGNPGGLFVANVRLRVRRRTLPWLAGDCARARACCWHAAISGLRRLPPSRNTGLNAIGYCGQAPD